MKRKMKILRSRKALSPVVASIILIAVTVAVSIAVARARMGALSFSFMNNGEQVQVGSPYGWYNGGSTVNITVSCMGGNAFTIVQVRVNNTACSFIWAYSNGTQGSTANAGPVAPQTRITLIVTYSLLWKSGYSYPIVIATAKNNEYQTTGTVQ